MIIRRTQVHLERCTKVGDSPVGYRINGQVRSPTSFSKGVGLLGNAALRRVMSLIQG